MHKLKHIFDKQIAKRSVYFTWQLNLYNKVIMHLQV